MTAYGLSRRALPVLASLLLLGALALPALPVRAVGTTYTVTSLGDTGTGSGLTGDLRFALTQVNAGRGGDTITFAVTGTITLTRALPVITRDVTITGPGADRLAISGNQLTRVFAIDHSVIIAISGLTITGGRTVDPQALGGLNGGGIFASFSVHLMLTDCVVIGNATGNPTAGQIGGGGGIYIGGGSDLNLERTVVRGNTAAGGGGGGIAVPRDSVVTIHNSTIMGNSAVTGGGISTTGSVRIVTSTISGNTAADSGGGVVVVTFHAGLEIIDSTITGNTARTGNGGGIFDPATLIITTVLTNSTVARNTAGGAGGGLFSGLLTGRTIAANTIMADNTASTAPDLSGILVSRGHNLIGDPRGASGIDPTDLTGVDPLLGPLGDNGGPTQTLPLLPGSPAIDAGGVTCPASYFIPSTGTTVTLTTDQRGVERPQGPACDIGAFERGVVGSPITLAPATLPDGIPNLPYTATFTASGGSGTGYTLAVTAGALPPGLTLSGAGVLSGTPTTKGTYRFTVTVRDSAGETGSASYTVVIGPAIPLPVRAPGSVPNPVPSGR